MKTFTATALVALMTATIGLSSIAPSFAQPAAPGRPSMHDSRAEHGPRMGRMGGGDMLNFARGAEAIEIALVRLSHRLELTDAQQPLFDALKQAALTAAADVATATEGLRPTPPAAGETAAMPDLSERFQARIDMQKAHLAALESVQPAFTAFFDSLTDEQVAQLTPQHPDRDGMPGGFGKGGPRHHDMQKGPMGGPAAAPDAPPAPAAPATNG